MPPQKVFLIFVFILICLKIIFFLYCFRKKKKMASKITIETLSLDPDLKNKVVTQLANMVRDTDKMIFNRKSIKKVKIQHILVLMYLCVLNWLLVPIWWRNKTTRHLFAEKKFQPNPYVILFRYLEKIFINLLKQPYKFMKKRKKSPLGELLKG